VNSSGNLGKSLRAKYEFRWDILDIIIGGKSSIDSQNGFRIYTADEADRFVRSYGFNMENPIEAAELHGNFHEAISFIRRFFLQPDNPDGLKLEIPKKILELVDVRDLFVMAALRYQGQTDDAYGRSLRNWACAILKVMHTIAHIDKDPRSSFFSDVQKQIFDRYYKHIHRDENNVLFLEDKSVKSSKSSGTHDDSRIQLVAFDTKPKKTRDSIILKMLHKSENVAEELFDRVGIRFVTVTLFDTLRVVKFLKDRMIVIPPNIKPSRSRNSLIDIDQFRRRLNELFLLADEDKISEADFVHELELAAKPPALDKDNPHSSEEYRAMQFTCRQLIKLKNPIYESLKQLKGKVKELQEGSKLQEDIQRTIEQIDLKFVQREVRFFYPYEVQVVDQKSAEENERGRSAHREYKKAQVQTAMKRVMGAFLQNDRG